MPEVWRQVKGKKTKMGKQRREDGRRREQIEADRSRGGEETNIVM